MIESCNVTYMQLINILYLIALLINIKLNKTVLFVLFCILKEKIIIMALLWILYWTMQLKLTLNAI